MAHTEKQIEKMRATIDAYDQRRSEQERAEMLENLEPLAAIVHSEAYQNLMDNLANLAPNFKDDFYIHAHLHAIVTAMPHLLGEIGRRIG